MMPIKQSKEQERLSKSRTITQAASSSTPTNADKTGVFFWNQRGVGKFRGVKSLTARNQSAEPKEVEISVTVHLVY